MTTTSSRLDALLAALPTLDAGTELIVRPGDDATATLRAEGLPPRVFARRDGEVVELCPAEDAGLPGRELLADRAELQRVLREHTGTIAEARLVAWRPGRRAVVRVGAADGSVHWLKLLDQRGHRRARRAFAALGESVAPTTLLLPSAELPQHCAFLAPNAPGRSLRTMLAAGDAVALASVARHLAALARTEIRGEVPTIDFARARAAAVDMLAKAAAVRGDLHDVAAAIGSLPAIAPPREPRFVHGDLHDKQLFLDGGRAFLIDLEGLGAGDARFDATNLAEHVRLRELQQGGTDSGLADMVLAGCGIEAGDPEANAFRLVVRARLCGVYALRPRWRALVDRLTRETKNLSERLQ